MNLDRIRRDAADARAMARDGRYNLFPAARARLEQCADHVDVLVSELEAAQKERDEAREALQLALNGIPDPMHPGIPPKFVDKLVAAQIVLMDAVGHDDPGNVAEARRVLVSAATPTPTKENK